MLPPMPSLNLSPGEQVIFEGHPSWRAILGFYLNTIFVTLMRTIGQVFFASMAAFAFSQLRFPGRDILFFALLSGLMVPEQVLIIPRYIIMRELGWLDTYQGLIIPLIFSSFGAFLLRQYFLGIPKDFQEAATIEGGSRPFSSSTPSAASVGR